MKKFLILLLFFAFSINSAFAMTCSKQFRIKGNGKTFMTTYKQKNGYYNKNANVGRYYNLEGQRVGNYKKKGKRIVAYDFKGHRISYCKKDAKGNTVYYNRSGIPSGYCR